MVKKISMIATPMTAAMIAMAGCSSASQPTNTEASSSSSTTSVVNAPEDTSVAADTEDTANQLSQISQESQDALNEKAAEYVSLIQQTHNQKDAKSLLEEAHTALAHVYDEYAASIDQTTAGY